MIEREQAEGVGLDGLLAGVTRGALQTALDAEHLGYDKGDPAVQRKALPSDDFEDLDEVADRLLSFQYRYNINAIPFDWRFTRDDLNRLLERIGCRDRHVPQPLTA